LLYGSATLPICARPPAKGTLNSPLFVGRLLVADDGSARFSFKLPPLVAHRMPARFIVRAHAVDSHHRFGFDSSTFFVRERVSIEPIVPSFLRIGDSQTIGVLLTIAPTAPASPVNASSGDDGTDEDPMASWLRALTRGDYSLSNDPVGDGTPP